jgi:hypothetical protein
MRREACSALARLAKARDRAGEQHGEGESAQPHRLAGAEAQARVLAQAIISS